MFLSRECGRIFNENVAKHGKAKTLDRRLEYFPCDSEVVNTKFLRLREKEFI